VTACHGGSAVPEAVKSENAHRSYLVVSMSIQAPPVNLKYSCVFGENHVSVLYYKNKLPDTGISVHTVTAVDLPLTDLAPCGVPTLHFVPNLSCPVSATRNDKCGQKRLMSVAATRLS
jgi:hypothetical protein